MKNPAIEFSNVSLNYNQSDNLVEVLKNISFSIKADEIVSIIGPSGSGKTSIIMLTAGLEKISDGTIGIHNRVINHLNENELASIRRQQIGIVFQSFYLIPSLSALENVLLALEANHKYGLEDHAKNLLEEFGLSHRLHHLPGELSGGEQQRVAVARALAVKPTLILADEPTGELDSATGMEIIKVLRDIAHNNGITVIVATHDLTLARMSDRVKEMVDGVFLESTNTV